MARTRSRWRREAELAIAAELALLPDGVTYEQKRAAILAVYPWGNRENHPWKMWQKVMREMLGPRPEPSVHPLPGIPTGTPADLAGMLLALGDDPSDITAQYALCDWLTDTSDGKAAEAGRILLPTWPDPETVAKVMYPRGRAVYATYSIELYFETRNGTGYKFPLKRIADQLAGQTLLIDPEVRKAAQVVQGRALLKLVIGENADV